MIDRNSQTANVKGTRGDRDPHIALLAYHNTPVAVLAYHNTPVAVLAYHNTPVLVCHILQRILEKRTCQTFQCIRHCHEQKSLGENCKRNYI